MNHKTFLDYRFKTGFLIFPMLFVIGTINFKNNGKFEAEKHPETRISASLLIGEGNYPGRKLFHSTVPGFSDSGMPSFNKPYQDIHSIEVGIPVKIFKAALVDNENKKWFLTEAGLISFDGVKWKLHNDDNKVDASDLNGIAIGTGSTGQEIWLATSKGVTVASLPGDDKKELTSYHSGNSPILSNKVLRVAVGKKPLWWFGTDKGIFALKADKWLSPSYEELYPEFVFQEFPILCMTTSVEGDTLYAGTKGLGVSRVFSNEVDGITGASGFAQWGPILMPSDTVNSIFITSDHVKWFGTSKGVARHTGDNTMENWASYTTEDGLVNNFVQAIMASDDGKIWFGTREGISVYDGSEWKSFTQKDGLVGNNVLCLALDKTGIMWIGTDNGVSSFENGKFTGYQ